MGFRGAWIMNLKSKNNISKIGITAIISMVFIIAGFSGCVENNSNDKSPSEGFYSFESDMQGWEKNGTDLDNPPINWSVGRSDEISTDGDYSVRFYLENFNDAGKIWMEKTFDVDPNSIYDIKISYNFATADFGDLNLFNIITTVLGKSLSGRETLNYEGDTGHHSDAEGYVWLDKEFEYIVETDDSGQIYINIGVWGSWETTRTYFVDELNITIEKQESIEKYPDISGVWNLNHYNWEGNLTREENVTIIQQEGDIEIQFDLMPPVEGKIIKNNIENPYNESDFIIRGVDFGGLGIDVVYIVNESYMITEIPSCESCSPSVFSK